MFSMHFIYFIEFNSGTIQIK